MTATVGANLGMNYAWASGEDGWNVGMDANLLKLDSLVQPNVIDSTINTPPGSPTVGDKYIVANGGSGAWNGLDAKIVIWSGSAWVSYTAKEGWLTYDQTNSYYLKCTGSAWMQDPFGDRAYAESFVSSQINAYVNNESQTYRWFEDFITTGSSTNNVYIAVRCRNDGMSTVSPLEAFTNASITGASSAMGWVMLFNTGGISASDTTAIQGFDGFSKIPVTASKELIFAGSLDTLPTNSTTTDCVHRIGMCGYGMATTANPVAQTQAAAYFQADKDGFWKCFSGKTGSSQSTTTAVATAAMTYISLRIVIAPTTGVVSFYIDGVLVATHDTAGAVSYEQPWYRFIALHNQGAGTFPSSGGLGGRGNLYIDAWGQMIEAASDRTNLRFLT
jgi:hypothetical protein